MRAQRILGILFLLVLVPTTLSAWFVSPVRAATLLVPSQYPTIQSAVTAARAGDTIQVAAGTYPENIVVSTRDLIIVGQNAATTVVDGGGKNTVFNIQANNVEIRQFTIRNGGRRFCGITVYYPYGAAVIRYNIIRDNVVGVVLSESSGNTVEGNIFLNNSMYGISSVDFSSTNTIRNNTVSGGVYGIQISDTSDSQVVNNTVSGTSYGLYVAYSDSNNVSANKAISNSWNIYLANSNSNVVGNNAVSGGAVGVQVMRSEGNTVLNNTVIGSSYGIYLGYCGSNIVSGNTASSTGWGIELYNSTGSTIKENIVKDGAWGFYLAENAKGNYIYHNNVLDNVKQAFQDLTSNPNTWNTPTTPYQGNYWSDYKGADTNGDGIGDTYLPWAGVDWRPLMVFWGAKPDVAIVSVEPWINRTYVGLSINVTVVARNEGPSLQTFSVVAKYDQSVVGTQTVTDLAPGGSATLIFTWNTAEVTIGIYVISANAGQVSGEVDLSDNFLSDGTVQVKIVADINGDGNVNIYDSILLSINFGRPASEYPDGDINGDGDINILDAILIMNNWTG